MCGVKEEDGIRGENRSLRIMASRVAHRVFEEVAVLARSCENWKA